MQARGTVRRGRIVDRSAGRIPAPFVVQRDLAGPLAEVVGDEFVEDARDPAMASRSRAARDRFVDGTVNEVMRERVLVAFALG